MTTSNKQKRVAIRQCKSVEKLVEAVEKVNGVDVEFSSQLQCIKSKMQEAYLSIYEDDMEITEELTIVRESHSEEVG